MKANSKYWHRSIDEIQITNGSLDSSRHWSLRVCWQLRDNWNNRWQRNTSFLIIALDLKNLMKSMTHPALANNATIRMNPLSKDISVLPNVCCLFSHYWLHPDSRSYVRRENRCKTTDNRERTSVGRSEYSANGLHRTFQSNFRSGRTKQETTWMMHMHFLQQGQRRRTRRETFDDWSHTSTIGACYMRIGYLFCAHVAQESSRE